MANIRNSGMNPHASEDANVENLRQEVEHLRLTNQLLWALLADISRKTQVSSAAIKASVSSLLGYDIVLGTAAQHELLEVIEDSTDQVSKNITLLTLVSQIEADTFLINPEPDEISEILAAVNETIIKQYPELALGFSIDASGSPVCIDYDYLSIALVMLYELIIQAQSSPQQLNIAASEAGDHWILDIGNVSQGIYDILSRISAGGINVLLQDASYLLPVKKLQLYVACKIFERLSIEMTGVLGSKPDESAGIRLMIPLAKQQAGTSNCE
jgi:K+-sensing histidine kinase KdpD